MGHEFQEDGTLKYYLTTSIIIIIATTIIIIITILHFATVDIKPDEMS